MYPHAAAIEITPTRISSGEVKNASQVPATLAIAKEIKAAAFTDLAEAIPLATKRIGPTRSASVPLTPSL